MESFPERSRKWTLSTEGGTEPVWSKSGRELFYRQGDLMMVVDVRVGAEFSAAKPRALFEGRYDVGVIGNPDYDVAADGEVPHDQTRRIVGTGQAPCHSQLGPGAGESILGEGVDRDPSKRGDYGAGCATVHARPTWRPAWNLACFRL